ncbi:outer membrane lipoprotein-sorting protein [Mariniflexile sp.]|uniref:outer membrane lipoprotein-sorting protein n=1 Tax=Mariniflexile sp. TaxID=1979402 RepID=UPI004047A0F6
MKIRSFIPLAFIAIISLFLISGTTPVQDSAKSIIEKADNKRLGKTSSATMTLNIIRPKWTREIDLKLWTKGKDLMMILITAPARDQGTAFLKRGDEIYNWVPRIERSIKLPPSSMLQSWMGSDFTNDDLVKQSSMVNDYEHTLIGKEDISGRQAYKVLLKPKEEASVVWGKVEAWVDVEESLFLKLAYYDEEGKLVNTLLGKNIKTMGGRTVTSLLEITPAKDPGNKTTLEYKSIEFDQPMDDSFFSLRNLKNLK